MKIDFGRIIYEMTFNNHVKIFWPLKMSDTQEKYAG